MKDNRMFLCPDCGGNLVYWEEKIIENITQIERDGTTGGTYSNITIIGETGCYGIRCLRCHASTFANGDNTFKNKEDIGVLEDEIQWKD